MRSAILSILIVAVSRQVYAGGACAFELVVHTRVGAPISGVAVVAFNAERVMLERKTTDAHGVARFCDPPLDSRLSFVIGQGPCEAAVQNVPTAWRGTRRIDAVYQRCESQELFGFCRVVIRTRDKDGSPIEGVRLVFEPPDSIESSTLADSFGRLFATLSWSVALEVRLEKSGYRTVVTPLSCDPLKSTSERVIVLVRAPGAGN